jgi:hypothetical protein
VLSALPGKAPVSRTLGACCLELEAWRLELLSRARIDARQNAARPGEFFAFTNLLRFFSWPLSHYL